MTFSTKFCIDILTLIGFDQNLDEKNSDETIGKMIADAMEKVGRDGTVTIEEANGFETTFTITTIEFLSTLQSTL